MGYAKHKKSLSFLAFWIVLQETLEVSTENEIPANIDGSVTRWSAKTTGMFLAGVCFIHCPLAYALNIDTAR